MTVLSLVVLPVQSHAPTESASFYSFHVWLTLTLPARNADRENPSTFAGEEDRVCSAAVCLTCFVCCNEWAYNNGKSLLTTVSENGGEKKQFILLINNAPIVQVVLTSNRWLSDVAQVSQLPRTVFVPLYVMWNDPFSQIIWGKLVFVSITGHLSLELEMRWIFYGDW